MYAGHRMLHRRLLTWHEFLVRWGTAWNGANTPLSGFHVPAIGSCVACEEGRDNGWGPFRRCLRSAYDREVGSIALPGWRRGRLAVHLGRGNAGVTKALLHLTQERTVADHLSGERMAQGVGGEGAVDTGVGRVPLQNKPESLAGQPIATMVQEEGRRGGVAWRYIWVVEMLA